MLTKHLTWVTAPV